MPGGITHDIWMRRLKIAGTVVLLVIVLFVIASLFLHNRRGLCGLIGC